jgi:raffinose/stachyose/melibiose transport system permease protein
MAVYPIFWMIISSLKGDGDFVANPVGLPGTWHPENFITAIETGNMQIAAFNSLYITVIVVILIVICSFFIAYFLNRFDFMGKKLINTLFSFGLLIPVHCCMVALYIQFSFFNLSDRWFSLFLPLTAFSLPLSIVLINNFLSSTPIEIEEAAIIDGASLERRMMYIVFPLCRPIVATLTILNALWTWNEFPFALVLINNTRLKTLPLMMTNFKTQYTTSYTLLLAALTLCSIPVIVVYSIFSKKIMQGMAEGAVKG